MMYRCGSCGHLFEDGKQAEWEERHGLEHGPYERLAGCPVCLGGYDIVKSCDKCRGWYEADELHAGWCEECLRETINFDTFFEYCEDNKEHQYLDGFVLAFLLGDMPCPEKISDEFHQLMIDTYKRKVMEVKLLSKTEELFDSCVRFIMEDDGYVGRVNYAEWLNSKKGVK